MADGPTLDGKVLTQNNNRPTQDPAGSTDQGISGDRRFSTRMITAGQGADLAETAGVAKLRNTFAGGQAIAAVLFGDPVFTTHGLRRCLALVELG